jgi:dipeptidyl aminopeptidase/acylaminoacyl peptidase
VFRSTLLALALTCGLAASAAQSQEPYRTPPEVVQRILDAPPLPMVSASPNGSLLLLAQPQGLPGIADLSRPMLRLAGLRINPATNGPFTASRGFMALTLQDTAGSSRAVTLPEGASVGGISWSPDGRWIAFLNTGDDGIALWVAEATTGAARALTEPRLNAVLGQPCRWMPDSKGLLCRMVPADRGVPPVESRVPAGPIVQRNEGRAAPVPTFQDLLGSPHDEALFEHYATSQLVLVGVASGDARSLGEPGIFLGADPAPGGHYLLIERVQRPFSYQVSVRSFPQEVEVWTLQGRRAATVASIPLAENVPVGGVRTGPRSFEWRPGEEATVVYVEALDGGNTRRPAEIRDRVVALAAPFSTPVELGRLGYRYGGTMWGRDGIALVSEFDRMTRHVRVWAVNTSRPDAGWRIVFDRSMEDRYGDPGSPVMTTDGAGQTVLLQSQDGRWIYLRGQGASPEGDRPFLSRMHLENRRIEQLWRSPADAYETVVEVLDTRARRVITRRETSTAPPNYYVADLRARTAPRAITRRENPAPELASVRRELVAYQREDGVGLSGTLYYPTDYVEGKKVPVVFWIYPREFASADAAGQVSGSAHRFVLPGGSSHLFLLTQGYAVLDNPTLPVVGGDTANNTYVQQTVAGAKAAIDYLMRRGIADGSFGVGGHSYGAFATANLLAHSDLFRTGVARSGAYNRTLTPFGFQSEQRTFWQARDVYLDMMPFSHADKINEPILLIHGMADNNSGTFPIQSERMYAALKGFGATVEYVQLPFESHGYAARESVMDVVARMIEWFDRYVKGGKAATE